MGKPFMAVAVLFCACNLQGLLGCSSSILAFPAGAPFSFQAIAPLGDENLAPKILQGSPKPLSLKIVPCGLRK